MGLMQASIRRLINSSLPLLIVSPSFSHGLSMLTLCEGGFEIPRVQNLYSFCSKWTRDCVCHATIEEPVCVREREHSNRSERKKAACTLIFSCYN